MYTHSPHWIHDADGGLVAVAHIVHCDPPDGDDNLCPCWLVDGSRVFLPAAEVARLHRSEPLTTVQGRALYAR